ncbi:MAG: tetratricopeptide repeat protein, partial [Okeania sp. SIO2F4]|uniref:tetratricopeptide repeat protein n=1 Tax=Okeania sp. SIO2F4 TaxID=2607790 RepID=UPI00142A9418
MKISSCEARVKSMVAPKRWLSILSVNSLMLFNVSFPVLMLPNIVNGAEVIVQTDKSAEAERLLQQGLELLKQGTAESWRQAIAKLEEALLLYTKMGNLGGEAATLIGIGRVYDGLGEKQKALNYYQQASAIIQQLRPAEGVVMAPTNAEAARLLKQGLELNKQGTIESRRQAITKWEEALLLYRKTGNLIWEASTLNNIGGIYSELGEKQKALNYYQQALPLFQQVGNKGGEAGVL